MDKEGPIPEIFPQEELEGTASIRNLLGGRGGLRSPAICVQGSLTKIKPDSCLMKATNSRSGTENMQRLRKEGSCRRSVSYLPPTLAIIHRKCKATL